MKFMIALLSFPALVVAYVCYPLLNQFDWKWLFLAFFIYCILLLRLFANIVDSPGRYGFGKGGAGSGGMDSGGFFGGNADGGDCGGGDC